MDNSIILFFAEMFKRLFAKSPLFFKIIQIVGVIVAVITGLPAFLESVHIVLPDAWSAIESKVISIAALVGAFVAALTVDRTTPGNNVLKVSRDGRFLLPFTAKYENKRIEVKEDVSVTTFTSTKAPVAAKKSAVKKK